MTLRQDQQPPLTRRQLREMERARLAEGGEQQVPAVELPFSASPAPVPAELSPVLESELPTPPAVQETMSAQEAASAQADVPAVPLTRRQLRALQQAGAGQHPVIDAVPESAQPVPTESEKPAPQPIVDVPISALPLPQVTPPAPPIIEDAPAIPAPSAAVPAVIDDAPLGTSSGPVRAFQPPTGHWSLAANESFDDVIAAGVTDAHLRSVESSGASTTANALIIPVIPSAADMTGPLNATGEILLTGSIDLPPGLGSTGQIQGRFDGSDIDRMLDQHDRDVAPDSSVEPVAATRAIATHAPAASPNIVPPKKTSHKVGAIVGSVAGGVAALGVAGVLIAGFVFHAF